MKIHRSYYKEYLFFFGTDEQATGEGALGQQVDDLLAANVAVGASAASSMRLIRFTSPANSH